MSAARWALWIGLASTMGCASRASVRAEIDIAAPPDVVWGVLSDTSRYGEWNPFVTRIEGALVENADILLRVTMRPGRAEREQKQHIMVLVPERCVVWQTQVGTRHTLRAKRSQLVVPRPDGGTHYRTTDVLVGGLVPLVMRLYRNDLERGFTAMTRALKVRAEALAHDRPPTVDTSWPMRCPSPTDP